ncbi:MAG: hypothetical protein WAU02_00340 [Candidatus Saccharimonadales bacterium]
MELTITPEQKKYLDKNGPMPAVALQRVYKKSVQDQQSTLKKAAKLRKKQEQ